MILIWPLQQITKISKLQAKVTAKLKVSPKMQVFVNVYHYTLSAKYNCWVFLRVPTSLFGCRFRVPAELFKTAAIFLGEKIHKIFRTGEYLISMSSMNWSRP